MFLKSLKNKTKYLYKQKKKNSGRNNTGRITVFHQGGGHKQLYRKINFINDFNTKGFVTNIEYDPNRTAYIAKICYNIKNIKKFFYMLAPQNLKVLDKISFKLPVWSNNNTIKTLNKRVGNSFFLKDLALGDSIYNLEIFPNSKKKFISSAGTSGQILQKSNTHALIKLPSEEERLFSLNCKASFGILSNNNHNKIIIKKAGKSRWLNIRPTVRGVAMNPIDHPHGGKTSGGKQHMTPWAKLTKGKPTRNKKKINKLIIKKKS